jgi:SAM-dependent methyltransferase
MNRYYILYADLFERYYPEAPAFERRARARRCAFHLQLVAENLGTQGTKLCDLCGLFGDFASGCAAAGMDATFVDDFADPCHADGSDIRFGIHRQYGAKAVKRDVIREGIDFPEDTFDAITCFGSMEHWHHSPKALFGQVVRALKPGGLFVLSAPNCVDIGKRISVPLGRGSWSSIQSWYNEPVFRGHVREPCVADLRYIARDMGLGQVQIFGRNWAASLSRNRLIRLGAPIADAVLRLAPSLCLSIYMMGRKSPSRSV